MRIGMAACAGVLLAAGAADAQSYDFEAPTYTASAGGTPLTTGFGGGGQDGWYNPVSGSADSAVVTYAGNTFGVPAHPSGGGQFQLGAHGGNAAFARAQHAVNFSAGGTWRVQMDILGFYNGVLPAADNLGSWSQQPSATARVFQTLYTWGTNTATAAAFNVNIGAFNVAPYNQAAPPALSPGPAFQNLPVNHWIRVEVVWDFTAAQVLEVSIQDLTAGGAVTTVDVSGMGWYLRGGPGSVAPLPTDIRLFTGGGGGTTPAGNVLCHDNVIVEQVTLCYPDCNNSGGLSIADFICFQGEYVNGCP